MATPDTRRIVRQSGVVQALLPPATLHREQAVEQIVDATGHLQRAAVAPFIPAQRSRFHVPGALTAGLAGGYDQAVRAGTITRVRAHVGTAPTSASCVVKLRDAAGNELATVTIPMNATDGASDNLAEPINGGTWFGLDIIQAGGAADLSAIVTQEIT